MNLVLVLTVTMVNVMGVVGGTADLPCDTSLPSPDDRVLLVLWYRDGINTPVYRLNYISFKSNIDRRKVRLICSVDGTMVPLARNKSWAITRFVFYRLPLLRTEGGKEKIYEAHFYYLLHHRPCSVCLSIMRCMRELLLFLLLFFYGKISECWRRGRAQLICICWFIPSRRHFLTWI